MSGKKTIDTPSSGEGFGCGLAVAFIPIALFYLVVLSKAWGLLFLFPALLTSIPLLFWLYGRVLLLALYFNPTTRGKRGILIWSNSANWKNYIATNWLPLFGSDFAILNWSEKKSWKNLLTARIFRHFCGTGENYCPSIILFRRLRHPLVYRYFQAFRDYKHGNDRAINKLNKHLFQKLDIAGRVDSPSGKADETGV